MLGSHGMQRKQRPFDEAIRVPLLLSCPSLLGREGCELAAPMDVGLDMMGTILELCGLPIPAGVQGRSFAEYVRTRGEAADPSAGAALLQCAHPFGEWQRKAGGREYRGLRTHRHTYTRTLAGPWLLFDNDADPFQLTNLIDEAKQQETVQALDRLLSERLAEVGDDFESGEALLDRWGYVTDENGTVPYTN